MSKKIIISCLLSLLLFSLFNINLYALTTKGHQIVEQDGTPIELKGVNWFGFNNQSTMVDGLWNPGTSLSYDFATAAYRMKLLGFNAVRLPFSFKDLYEVPPRNFAQNCTLSTVEQIQANVTNPAVSIPKGTVIPPLPYSPDRKAGVCNNYLPNSSTLDRFVWTAKFFAKNGFYVLVDNHLREDQTALEDPNKWVQYWVQLITVLSQDPDIKGKLMVDILNEPDNFGIRWEGSGGKPALKDLYLSAMDAIYPINKQVLFFIEGTGQGGIDANWGDGFATNPQLISQYGLSDPNAFFKALAEKSYANQVVISPHVYPPSVTNAGKNYSGAGFWNRLSNSFGYLTQEGYCTAPGKCKAYPVALGEFGSNFTDQRDLTSLDDLARYLNNKEGGADGRHNAIPNWFYWSWNPNSGDTGGIVADNWVDVIWKKINFLTKLNLTPWYVKGGQQQPEPPKVAEGSLCVVVTPASGLTKALLKPFTIGSNTFEMTDLGVPICKTLTVGDYSVTPPKITTATQEFTATPQTSKVLDGMTSTIEIVYKSSPITPPPAPTGAFSVKAEVGSSWLESPGVYNNTINLQIKNNSATAIKNWKINISNPSYVGLSSSWNFKTAAFANGTVTGTVEEDWQTLLPNGGNSVNVGLIIKSKSQDFIPASITINGVSATITK